MEKAKKPEYDKLKCPVQVLLKENEFKRLDAIRREKGFPSLAGYVRMILLKIMSEKNQLEMF